MHDSLILQRNSFHVFLIMLSRIIRHYTREADNRKVQIIFNRIFLKLGPKKFENMTDKQAVHNIGLMFLTMISATSFHNDYPRVSNLIQLVPLYNGPNNLPVDARIKHMVVAAQAHMSLLVVFSSSSFDKTKHIVSLLQGIDVSFRKYGSRIQPILEIIAQGMQLIYSKAVSKQSFSRGEKHLIGPWIQTYLRNSSSTRERQKLLEVILDSFHCPDLSFDYEYFNAIDQYIMPYVNEKFSSKDVASPCIARIAARMTLQRSSNLTKNFQQSLLFTTYINCPTACPEHLLVYLKELTQSSKIVSLLGENVIIQQRLKMGFYIDRESLLDLTN